MVPRSSSVVFLISRRGQVAKRVHVLFPLSLGEGRGAVPFLEGFLLEIGGFVVVLLLVILLLLMLVMVTLRSQGSVFRF